MPEQHRPPRNHIPLKLSAAHRNGSLIEAHCHGCSPARYYLPEDLMRLFDDIPVFELRYRMPCERCGKEMNVATKNPTAAERMQMRVRRLDRVWTVRRASWRVE